MCTKTPHHTTTTLTFASHASTLRPSTPTRNATRSVENCSSHGHPPSLTLPSAAPPSSVAVAATSRRHGPRPFASKESRRGRHRIQCTLCMLPNPRWILIGGGAICTSHIQPCTHSRYNYQTTLDET